MLAERNLSVFAVMADGNLGKGIRKLRGLPEPEPKPEIIDVDDNEVTGDSGKDKEAEEERIVVDLTLPPKREVIDIDILMAEEERLIDGGSATATPATKATTPATSAVGKISPKGEPEDGEEVEIIE